MLYALDEMVETRFLSKNDGFGEILFDSLYYSILLSLSLLLLFINGPKMRTQMNNINKSDVKAR